ncbi:MAG: Holliday junction branch migration protein RuvA [Chloroflexota bacterium]
MIASLRGTVAELGPDSVVLDVGGVGYLIHVTPGTRARLPEIGRETRLFTHYAIREDAVALYGFSTREERGLFELLLSVSGIGPKVALGMLAGTEPASFSAAVAGGDVAYLTRLPGVGKKTAQRLLLELKDKVGSWLPDNAGEAIGEVAVAAPAATERDEALQALLALGFSQAEAAQAVARAAQETGADATAEDLIRSALKRAVR